MKRIKLLCMDEEQCRCMFQCMLHNLVCRRGKFDGWMLFITLTVVHFTRCIYVSRCFDRRSQLPSVYQLLLNYRLHGVVGQVLALESSQRIEWSDQRVLQKIWFTVSAWDPALNGADPVLAIRTPSTSESKSTTYNKMPQMKKNKKRGPNEYEEIFRNGKTSWTNVSLHGYAYFVSLTSRIEVKGYFTKKGYWRAD